MKNVDALEAGAFYHIYNRAVGQEVLFPERQNYSYFLGLWKKHLQTSLEVWAYCLLPNHFHAVVRLPDEVDVTELSVSFKGMFSAYAQAINKQEERQGSLFMKPFRRKKLDTEAYLSQVIRYVHLNPWHHQVQQDFASDPWSSYGSILSTKPTLLRRKEVLDWFGGAEEFKLFHTLEEDALPEGIKLE